MIFKLVIIVFFIFVLYTLGTALFALARSSGHSDVRMVKALTYRVALSLGLFILLMLGYATGIITPNTAVPSPPKAEIQAPPQQ
ncbi:twin transmembrane helix small protein [Nitrosococcus watsonii]|uniref:Transmembrane protein n=1 Tax=Nitrosococcus watsoni (strain C-113) TaxID=105559 RepID=D8K4L0_NITWC|nr:twin transmembrane helix small protein [Nitrosococcus watsonii]ADJ29812.1 conserved hypothetical protein [Nitrosococcus watsonii C-113]